MNNIKVVPLNLETDLPEIEFWDEKFKNDPKFDTIRKFVLEDDIYFSLRELIDVNYEKTPIGTSERRFAHCIKNKNNKMLGFVISNLINLRTEIPELVVFYVVIHPYEQGKGIGKTALSELFTNTEKYFNTKVSNIFTRIDKDNINSQKLFKSLGFDINYTDTQYLSANKLQSITERM